MVLVIEHPEIDTSEQTSLTTAVSAGNTGLAVQNNQGFSANDYILIENIGSENAEIVKISSLSGNTTINTDALKFSHGIDTPITYIKYNQIKIYRASSKTGSYSLLATVNIEVDYPNGTRYDDTTGTSSSWYKVTYYNSTSLVESDYSDPIPATGIPDYYLRGIQNAVVTLANDPLEQRIRRDDITRWINEIYRKVQHKVRQKNLGFGLTYSGELSFTAGQAEYDLPTDFAQLYKLEVAMDGISYRNPTPLDMRDVEPTRVFSPAEPYFYFIGNKIGFQPTPNSGTYRMWYYSTPQLLSSDGDELLYPYNQYPEIFINYAMFRFCQIHKPERVAEFKGLADEAINTMLTDLAERQIHRPDFVHITSSEYYESLLDQSF
uniref:Uncharacterized protein n=1 Tax=candidate division CPR3 bacterium TaxID=2268181 RepID=A0A7V3JA78_UNCC3